MVHSSLLNFDPFAIHPFTNTSGVVPQPPQPMQHPIPIPVNKDYSPYPSSSPGSTSSSPSSVSTESSIPLHSPSPRRRAPDTQPIFVPYRREASTPDLVLKKKSPSQSQSIGGYPSNA